MRALVAALLIAGAAHADAPRAFRDRFVDGSGRAGPVMVRVGAIAFDMGGRPEDPGYTQLELRHPVELSTFAIARYEVTTEEFVEFLNQEGNPSYEGVPALAVDDAALSLVRRHGDRFEALPGAERRPIVAVTWQGSRAFCRWLSRMTGERYELPTEAQWEAAARAGADTTWPWGDRDDVRRYRSRASAGPQRSAPVGSYAPNRWGLYDMAGNVWEWVLDCFDPEFFLLSPPRDPLLLDDECLTPDIRGGSFRDLGDRARPAFRTDLWWTGRFDNVGFRVARAVDDAPAPVAR